MNKVIGENAAVRVNAMYTDAGSTRDVVESDRRGILPSVSWGIGTAQRIQPVLPLPRHAQHTGLRHPVLRQASGERAREPFLRHHLGLRRQHHQDRHRHLHAPLLADQRNSHRAAGGRLRTRSLGRPCRDWPPVRPPQRLPTAPPSSIAIARHAAAKSTPSPARPTSPPSSPPAASSTRRSPAWNCCANAAGRWSYNTSCRQRPADHPRQPGQLAQPAGRLRRADPLRRRHLRRRLGRALRAGHGGIRPRLEAAGRRAQRQPGGRLQQRREHRLPRMELSRRTDVPAERTCTPTTSASAIPSTRPPTSTSSPQRRPTTRPSAAAPPRSAPSGN